MTQPPAGYGQTPVRDDDDFLTGPAPYTGSGLNELDDDRTGTSDASVSVVPDGPGPSSATGTTGSSKVQDVKQGAVEGGGQVASTAKEQATEVAREAKTQARDLFHEGRSEALRQAGEQQNRVAQSLRSLSDELGSMAQGSQQNGLAAELARQASGRADDVADWFERREPGEILDDVRDYARRHPWTFLGVAAAAGLVVGRLGRAAAQNAREGGGSGSTQDRTIDVSGYRPPTDAAVTAVLDEPNYPPHFAPTTAAGEGTGSYSGEYSDSPYSERLP